MNNQEYRTPLRKAVDWLISEGKIRQDKDLQEIFQLSKSTISAYLTGKPGKQFVNKFEKHFGLSIEKFDNSSNDNSLLVSTQSNAVPQSEVIEMLNAHIRRLESNYDKHIKDLNERAAKEAALFEWIKRIYEEQKEKLLTCLEQMRTNIDSNSKESEERQITVMAQIKAASKIAAERAAAGDQKRLAEELKRLDTYVGEFSK